MIALVITLLSATTDVTAPAPLLGPADLVSAQILPPPPAVGSSQYRIEKDELANVEKNRTPSDFAAAAKDSETKDASVFREAIGPSFELDRLPQTALLMSMVRTLEKAAADRAKVYFKRPRPWIGNPAIHACSRDDEPNSSYPSGHTTMAYSMASILSRLVPERAPAIMARAARYAQSRIVCEVHFRSDVTAGEALGLVVGERLMQKPQFRAQFERAHQELVTARLTT